MLGFDPLFRHSIDSLSAGWEKVLAIVSETHSLFRQVSDHPCRHAGDQHVVRETPGDHCAGRDDHIVADGNARIDHGIATDPDVVADGDWFSELNSRDPSFRIERVTGGEDGDPRAYHAVPAYSYLADIEDDEIEVRIKILSEMDVVAVIALER